MILEVEVEALKLLLVLVCEFANMRNMRRDLCD